MNYKQAKQLKDAGFPQKNINTDKSHVGLPITTNGFITRQ